MKILKALKSSAGQSLIEILIGLALIVLGLGSAVVLVYGGQLILLDRDNTSTARALAREGIEGGARIVKANWNGISDGNYGLVFATGTWQFSSSSDTALGVFTRTINVKTVDVNQREVKSTVSWSASPLRNLSVELITLITNWTEVQITGGDTGGSPPTGDWQNPRTLGSLDLGPGNSATDLDVKNKIVYLTSEASDPKKHDFFIVDATNGQNPFIVTSTNTGKGLLGIDVAGNYAYMVGKDDAAELYVFDISSINSPVQVASLNLSGNQDGFTVFYHNGYLFIGRGNGATQEFVVVDVTDPLSPSVVGGLSDVGDEINDIFVVNNRAYLGTEENGRGMIIVDVTIPASPQVLGSFNSNMQVYGIYAQNESRVYVGGNTKFFIVDSTNPASIITLSTSTIDAKTRDIAFATPYAFLATEDSNKEFQVWNVSNPQSPTLWSSFNFSQVASGIDYEDNIVYVSVRSNDGLRIITSQ